VCVGTTLPLTSSLINTVWGSTSIDPTHQASVDCEHERDREREQHRHPHSLLDFESTLHIPNLTPNPNQVGRDRHS